jgi:hypothetical protein
MFIHRYIYIYIFIYILVSIVVGYGRNRRDSYPDRQDDFSLSSLAENGSGFRAAFDWGVRGC